MEVLRQAQDERWVGFSFVRAEPIEPPVATDAHSRLTLSGQPRDNLLQKRIRLGLDGVRLEASQRMGSDCHGQFGHSQSSAFHLTQDFETMGTDGNRGDTAPLQFYGVVDTPRRAGASITQTDDRDMGRGRQRVHDLLLGGDGRRGFALVHDVGNLVLLTK